MPPTPQELEQIMERKNKMRRQAYDARAAQEDKDEVSATICEQFIALLIFDEICQRNTFPVVFIEFVAVCTLGKCLRPRFNTGAQRLFQRCFHLSQTTFATQPQRMPDPTGDLWKPVQSKREMYLDRNHRIHRNHRLPQARHVFYRHISDKCTLLFQHGLRIKSRGQYILLGRRHFPVHTKV